MAGSAPAGMYWNWSAREMADVPSEFWTVTSIADAGSVGHEGVTAVIAPSARIVNELAARLPNLTAVAPRKPEPKSVIEVPPDAEPVDALKPTTVGAVVELPPDEPL